MKTAIDGCVRGQRSRLAAGMAVLLLAVAMAACGDDDSSATADDGDDGELREITVAIPAPVTVPFYPLWIAESRGYLAEEDLSLGDHVNLESSGQVLQAVTTGDVTVGLASLGPLASAVAQGGDLRSVYALYEHEVTQIAVPEDGDIESIEDLEGSTIGTGPSDAGPTVLARGVLSSEFGWVEGEDYTFLEVGDGGAANVAFDRGDIDAYANSFLEMATLDLAGFEYRNVMPEVYDEIPNTLAIVTNEMIEGDPELVEGLGRAMARATVWGMEHPEEVAQVMVDEVEPEAAERLDFMVSLVEISNTLFEVPPAGNEQWGWHSEEGINFQLELLASQGTVEDIEGLEAGDLYTNDHLDAFNDFEASDL